MSELVSIITPLFNAEKYILKTYASIVAQSYVNWEWVVVDDGSSDKSYQMVASLANKDPRIKLFKRNRLPQNASTCRNIGVENSLGSYFVFLDADDLLVSTCLTNRVQVMEQFPEIDFGVFRTFSFKEENGDVVLVRELIPNNDLSDLENFLKFNYPWTTTSSFWRKSAIQKLNGFDESFNRLQDPEIHIRAIINNLAYEKFTLVDSYHRLVFKGIAFPSKSKTKRIYEGYLAFINAILIPNDSLLNKKPYIKHIKFSFSGTIRNYLLYYNFYTEIKHLADKMKQYHYISKLEHFFINFAVLFNKIGIKSKYINKLLLMPLEK